MKNHDFIKLGYYHRKEHILDVAAELFAAKGYDAVTTLELSKAVGCSEALLLNIFRSKSLIYEALFDEWKVAIEKKIELPIIKDSALVTLKKFFNEYISRKFQRNNSMRPRLESALYSRLTNDSREKMFIALKHAPDFVVETVKPLMIFGQAKGEIRDGSPDELASLFWALIWGEIQERDLSCDNYQPISFDAVSYIFENR